VTIALSQGHSRFASSY